MTHALCQKQLVLRILRVQLPAWLFPVRKFRSAINDSMDTWESILWKGLLRQKKRDGRLQVSIQPFRVTYDATSEACCFKLPCLCPCSSYSLECLHSHLSGEKKAYKPSNILSSVKYSTTAQAKIVISFSLLPEPVLGLSGPRSLHCPSLLCKAEWPLQAASPSSWKSANFQLDLEDGK